MSQVNLTLSVLQELFAVCRFEPQSSIPVWSLQGFFSITRTADELSIVCPQSSVPLDARMNRFEGDWRCLKVEGPLDFALTGILVAIAAPLAIADISIFAISTYETDYVLVKQGDLDETIRVLSQAGHQVVNAADQTAGQTAS
ncbi:MAG: ACT domain-containing protein [Leptolyngbya sp. BL-A-14]